jgi:hypothetical protein
MHTNVNKVEGTFIPAVGVCAVLHMHAGLVSSLCILVVDIVLLLTMLIGLLRHAHKHPTGIWKLLYQQVTPKNFVFSTVCWGMLS